MYQKLSRILKFLLVFLPCVLSHHNHIFAQTAEEQEAVRSFKRNAFKRSAEQFESLSQKEPREARHLYNQGVSLFEDGQFPLAEKKFQQAAESSDPRLSGQALYNLGNTYVALGDLQKAEEAFKNAVAKLPDDQAAKDNWEWVKRKLQQPPENNHNQKNSDQKQKQDQTPSQNQKNQTPNSNADQTKQQQNQTPAQQQEANSEKQNPTPTSDPQQKSDSTKPSSEKSKEQKTQEGSASDIHPQAKEADSSKASALKLLEQVQDQVIPVVPRFEKQGQEGEDW